MSTETVGRAERDAWLRVLPQAATADTDTAPTDSRRRLRADDGS
jgi:hypothetical protein